MVHACRLAGPYDRIRRDDGTFRIGDLRSFQVCVLPEHLFSFSIDQWVNLRAAPKITLRMRSWWANVLEVRV
jgi:hypothetical protein